MTKLAILIPTTPDREPYLDRLLGELFTQRTKLKQDNEVEVLVYKTEKAPTDKEPHNTGPTTGEKRNELIRRAVALDAKYIAFFDDDDMPGETYLQRQLEVVHSGADCGSLWGQIYWSGVKGKPFHHFLACKEWWEDAKFYYRCPNHLNCIKLDIAKEFKFPEQNFGEDGQWSMAINNAGALKTEYVIKDVIYHYFCGWPKHSLEVDNPPEWKNIIIGGK